MTCSMAPVSGGMMSSSLYGVQQTGVYLVGEESDPLDSYLGIVVVLFRFHPDIFINRSILSAFFAIVLSGLYVHVCRRLPLLQCVYNKKAFNEYKRHVTFYSYILFKKINQSIAGCLFRKTKLHIESKDIFYIQKFDNRKAKLSFVSTQLPLNKGRFNSQQDRKIDQNIFKFRKKILFLHVKTFAQYHIRSHFF